MKTLQTKSFMNRIEMIVASLIVLTMFSCENSITIVKEVTRADTLESVSAKNIVFIRSDSGNVKIRLTATLMKRFEGKEVYTEFPEGFEAFFYDSLNKPSSRIRADYGISYENTKLMIARNNVEVENFNTLEKLNTESLYWNQKKKIIFTSAFVKITSPGKVIFGDSLTANEGFDKRTIHNIRATIELDEEGI